MYYNSTYLLCMAPAFLLMVIASIYVKSAYKKWSQVATRSQINGYEAAQRLILRAGLQGVQIEGVSGTLTDNYDPRTKILHLSQGVAGTASVASVAVAAHELGHAQQDAQGYFPLRFRSALVPMVSIGSNLGWILIIVGLLLTSLTNSTWGVNLAWLGVAIFAGGAVFALATLPVELNASSRARAMLSETGIVSGSDEQRGVSNVLNAAALTYVAALVSSVLQLLYYVSLVGGAGRRRN
jgi:Zn-dependent membrane protease YugP